MKRRSVKKSDEIKKDEDEMRWCDDKDIVGRKWTLSQLCVRSSHSILYLVMGNDFYDDH